MKVELRKETEKYTGAIMHYVYVIENDGKESFMTCKSNPEEAEKALQETICKVKEFPVTTIEVIKSIEI